MFCYNIAYSKLISVEGQNSTFRAVNISSLPVNFIDYGLHQIDEWTAEDTSDSDYGPKEPHVSGKSFAPTMGNLFVRKKF